MTEGDDVVITGLGVMSPIGCDERSFWNSLSTGQSGAGPVVGLNTSDLPRNIACQVKDFVPPVSRGGRATSLAAAAARQAVLDACLTTDSLRDARVNVIMGTTMGESEFIEERLNVGSSDWLCDEHLHRITVGTPGAIARGVKAELGLTGPAVDLYGACCAGNMALESARRALQSRRCDVAVAGGADGFSRLAFIGFMRLRVMAAERCRPFDLRRDGLLVGEGAGVFILERESQARARGARIRARISGASISCEDYHPTRPHPEGDGLARCVAAALREAALSPTDLDYICAHGTGTPQNDAIEVKVMERCFREGMPFSSIKSLTGHTMGAAAALEAACCVLSLEHQTIIPTWNLETVLEPCSLDAVSGSPRPAKLGHVLNNSAGFGGYNSSVLLSAA